MGCAEIHNKTITVISSVAGDGEEMGLERENKRVSCSINKSKLWVESLVRVQCG